MGAIPTRHLLVRPHPDDEDEVRRAFEEEDDGGDLVLTPQQLDAWAERGVLPWGGTGEDS